MSSPRSPLRVWRRGSPSGPGPAPTTGAPSGTASAPGAATVTFSQPNCSRKPGHDHRATGASSCLVLLNLDLAKGIPHIPEPGRLDQYTLSMKAEGEGQAEFSVSDYSQIGPLHEWLKSVPGIQVDRIPGVPGDREMGAVDVLTVLAGSSGIIAAIRMIPEFLRSRRSDISITVTVNGEKFSITASNVKDTLPILERAIRDQ
jgi:hypothetical protein